MADLADKLEAAANDPMWNAHAEVPKSWLRAAVRALRERDQAVEALKDVLAHLVAAISLLEKGGKAAKKAAPSDRMFDMMIEDYKASCARARANLSSIEGAEDAG